MPTSPLSAAEYQALVEHAPMLIWRAGLDAKCDYFNEGWLAFTGRTLEQESGDGWAEGVHPDDLKRCVDHYLERFARREAFEMEYRLKRHDGVYRWILDRGTPFSDERGNFAGFIGSCVDVDDRRRSTEERERRGEQALAVAHDFERWLLGIVGHDIRNPLSAVLSGAHYLTKVSGDPAAVLRGTERIERAAKRITQLVDDLLDMTRERRGGIPIAASESDLAAICRDMAEELRPAFAGRQVHVTGPAQVRGVWDANRLAQAVSNLLSNALQHGLPGTPVSLKLHSSDTCAVVEVHNHGTIPDSVLPHLFQPFQAERPTVRRSEGLGLGLFIANGIVKAHDGDLEVTSSEERGTTFRMSVPRQHTTHAPLSS